MSGLTFSERLRALMSAKKITQLILSRAVGVTQGAVSGWLNGALPKMDKLLKIAEVLGVEPVALINLEGLRDSIESADKQASLAGGGKDHENADFIRRMSAVAEDAPALSTKATKTKAPVMASNVKIIGPVDEIFFGTVPVISWAHAGTATSYEELPSHWQERIPTMCRGKRAFGLTIEGDSMITQCQPGDIVTVDPDVEPRNGCLVVVKMKNDGVMLRRFTRLNEENVRLIAYNTLYPSTEHALSEFHWIYPVHSTFRRELF